MPNVKITANYSVSVETSLPDNGVIIYDFPSFDHDTIDMIAAIESVRAPGRRQFEITDDGDNLILC